MFPSWVIFIILVFGLALLFLVSRRKNVIEIDRAKVKRKWQELKELEEQGRYKEAIMEADKLFDFVLKGMNITGATMGERLIKAERLLSNYHDIWEAHKVRNKLVHEVDFNVDSSKTEAALKAFGKGIRQLKAM